LSSAKAVPPRVALQDQKPQPAKGTIPANGVDEFQKWCRLQLKSLTGVNCISLAVLLPLTLDDEIYQMLMSLPLNESSTHEIISDTIYTHSPTLDGRHFAEEFIKRRRVLGTALDATVLPAMQPTNSGSGWNEVLKKEKGKDASGEWNSAFKVVAGKKGRRRG